jgi:hypothetical protein
MMDIYLNEDEAKRLLEMPKIKENDNVYSISQSGGKSIIPLLSIDKRERFYLDLSINRIDIKKGKYQNRARQVFVLARVDFNGSPHRNPDGTIVNCPHLHIYTEKYADKYAIELPQKYFANTEDLFQLLDEFMKYCNIINPPIIQRSLF